ncbi:cell wall-binding repeat-containing protein [Clostridioides mangenotii]|uniref:cell wall-binding repeat-containing protein n=1 Tax=Metaclostridioides mangenotii TaxID=1540 RepID=UPI00214A8188|nr:cell wall-binding repeat-containing protein [Clostridioides mangenotii]MCR1953238.1 cell wall-binding repeat-containing protein [Clostridioides mangenotii]
MRHYKKLLSLSKFTKKLVTITLAFSLIIPIVNTTFAYDNLEIRDKISLNEAKSSNSSYEENKVLEKENNTPGEEGILFKDAFDDENFKSYIKMQIMQNTNINEDKYKITSETFKNVDTLNLDNKGIKSLKGIEYFESLRTLDCSKNALESLDLSKNEKLSNLVCNDNNLKSLDLYKNNSLNYILCFSNSISKLVLPEQVDLGELNCSNNNLSKLELPKNSNIVKLDCTYNNLTSLVLPESNIEKLYCGNNKLTNLDVSRDVSLKKLYCSFNKLDNLNLSKNINLSEAELGTQSAEYNLIRHNSQYSINVGKNIDGNNFKSSVEVLRPIYGQYTSDGYIDLGYVIIFDDDDYASHDAKFNRIYKINDKSFAMAITAKLKKAQKEETEEDITKIEYLTGKDRYDTAVKISQNAFTSANNIILVNDSSLPDALSVTPYAKVKNAPILLTQSNKLNDQTRKEIERLKAKNLYIIGGENSVSKDVKNDLESRGYIVERISGEDRYATSLKVAKELDKISNISEISVVNGEKGLADAVSIGAISAQNGMPIILTNQNDNMVNIIELVKDENIKKTYVVGGDRWFPNDIANKLPSVERISGIDRNMTNLKVINRFYKDTTLNNIYVSKNGMGNQDNLIDALSVGVVASKKQSPVMLVGDSLNISQKLLIKNKKFKVITQVGGEGNENAFNELKELLK